MGLWFHEKIGKGRKDSQPRKSEGTGRQARKDAQPRKFLRVRRDSEQGRKDEHPRKSVRIWWDIGQGGQDDSLGNLRELEGRPGRMHNLGNF